MSSTVTFTLDQYERMIACGAFGGQSQKPIELIGGELRMMSPQGAEHAELVAKLNDWSHDVIDRKRLRIRVQSSIEIPESVSQPEPDVVWVEAKSYARRRPRPPEVLLLVEVADTSLAYDMGEKCQVYCAAGIGDYWVVDIAARMLHVFRDPQPGGYRRRLAISGNDQIAPLASDRTAIVVAELFRCLDG
jgi:Uma2 family endonuclease